jgi:hypothetical protein
VTSWFRLPQPLASYLATIAVPAILSIVVGVIGLSITLDGARDARAAERRSVRVNAVVVDGSNVPGSGPYRLPVSFVLNGTSHIAQPPTIDRDAYDVGMSVEVWVDPRNPDRVRLTTEPYDAASPVTLWSLFVVLGVTAIVLRLWRVRRLVRLATSTAPTWSFHGQVVGERRFGLDRQWLVLRSLDGSEGQPVAGFPLLRGQATWHAYQPLDTLVRGEVNDGGTAVALVDGLVLWPAGRVKAGRNVPGFWPRS